MGKPSNKTADEKAEVVIAVLRGELTVAAASRVHGVSEQSVHGWKSAFLEGGRIALARRPMSPPSDRERDLEAEVAELTRSLADAKVRLLAHEWGTDRLPPSQTSR